MTVDFEIENIDDFYNKDKVEDVLRAVRRGNPILLQGPPGTGKTAAAHFVADKLGYDIIEVNTSDKRNVDGLRALRNKITQKLLAKTIFLLDEFDGINFNRNYQAKRDILQDMFENAENPVILTANEGWQIPQTIKKFLVVRDFDAPYRYDIDIKDFLRKKGYNVDDIDKSEFEGRDMRSAMIKTIFGGEDYKTYNPFDIVAIVLQGRWTEDLEPIVNRVFQRGNISPRKRFLTWLLDNAIRNLNGRELLDFLELIAIVDRTRNYDFLKEIVEKNRNLDIKYPRFNRRLRALRGGGG